MASDTHSGALGLRTGDTVEVRSRSEILATLDAQGCLESLPFMPEMLAHCGGRFRVYKRADKTCDTITGAWTTRRMTGTVHLDGLRCDGHAHAGCQAFCLLFWKEAWLKRVASDDHSAQGRPSADAGATDRPVCTVQTLHDATIASGAVGGVDTVFRCQSTELVRATTPMSTWDPHQYVRDLRSGNVSLGRFLKVFVLNVFNAVQRRRGRPTVPDVRGTLKKTPADVLNLQAGELVRVKSRGDIVQTLDTRSRNRGLSFDPEMVRYCGKTFRVLARADRVIDEKTGRMVQMPNDCIVLEGATCVGDVSAGRLFCPRNIYPFWREIWLERVQP